MEAKEKQHIFLASPHMSEEGYEQMYIKEAFETNWIAPLGKNVDEFEKEICQKLGAKDAAALSSGTAAIHLALKLLEVGSGDIVFCSSLTFAATVNPVVYEGATPVFIDSEYATWNMDPMVLEQAFKKYKARGVRPKAVIFAHLYGICADLDAIMEVCRRYDCPVIEDAAESLGTKYRGRLSGGKWKYTGTFGDYGIISFNGNKIITSSGGGMLLCNTEDAGEKAEKARFFATQARDQAKWYQHTEIGYNYRMSNVVAGIGRGQLKVLDQRVEKKRAIYEYYRQHIGDLEGLELMPQPEHGYSNCWLTCMQLGDECRVGPEDIMEALEKDDVESRPVWKPMHCQPVFKDCDFIGAGRNGTGNENPFKAGESADNQGDKWMGADTTVSGTIFRKGVCLPSDTKMEEAELIRICKVIRELWKL